jgi:formamidopyrimidine-DNA glycosylase
MPELPEVEVTRRGIAPHLEGRSISNAVVRHRGMRWPVPADLPRALEGLTVASVGRRGKYLLIECVPLAHDRAASTAREGRAAKPTPGWLILHLGMSGSLRVLPPGTLPKKHDHFDLVTADSLLRLHDPRRFGAVLWHPANAGPVEQHTLLAGLGVEPLSDGFHASVLHRATRGRKAPIKQALLAGDIVVGVGNIYASEALFRARINPKIAAGRISLARYAKLTEEIRTVLTEAITKGGSTLRDFSRSDGEPGYFQLDYFVYGRTGLPCRVCAGPIRMVRQGQRSTFYCPVCQK